MEFSWKITAIPEVLTEHRPTAHVIFDTTRMNRFLIADLEAILYGDSVNNSRFPSISELIVFIKNWVLITITDNGNGTWTATGPDELITLLDPTTFQITEANAVYLDPSTYQISTTYP